MKQNKNCYFMNLYLLVTRKVPPVGTVTMELRSIANVSEQPDIPATTHIWLPHLCFNNSRSLKYIYTVDNKDDGLLNWL